MSRKLSLLLVVILLTASSYAQVAIRSNPGIATMSRDGYLRGGAVKVVFEQPYFAYSRTVLTVVLNRKDLKFSELLENKPVAYVNDDQSNWLSIDVSADRIDIDIRKINNGVTSITVKGFIIDAIGATDPNDMVTTTLSLSDGLTMDLPTVTLMKIYSPKNLR